MVAFAAPTPMFVPTSGVSVSRSAMRADQVLPVLARVRQESADVPDRPGHAPRLVPSPWVGGRPHRHPRRATGGGRASSTSLASGTSASVIRVVTDGRAARVGDDEPVTFDHTEELHRCAGSTGALP